MEFHDEENLEISTQYNYIGDIYEKMNKNSKAIEYYIKSADIYSRLLNEDPKGLVEEYLRISQLLKDEGRHEESKEYQLKAQNLQSEKKKDAPQKLSFYDIAISLVKQSKLKEALAELKKGIESINKKTDKKEELSLLAKLYDTQGNIFFRQQKFQEARESFEKAQNYFKKVYGENSPEMAGIYNNIAGALLSEGKTRKALENARKAEKIIKSKEGEENVIIGTTYMNLGRISIELEDYEEALEYFEKAYNVRKKLLGEENPETAAANEAYSELLKITKEEDN